MTSTVPPRDWTDIHWPEIASTAAARWIAVLPLAATEQHGPHLPVGTDVMIAEAYLARVRELLPRLRSRDLPAGAAGRDFHRAHRLSGHADAADRGRAEDLDGARRKCRARRDPEIVMVTSHGGNSAAMTLVAQDLRAQHGLLAVTTSWSRFGSPEELFAAEELRHGIHGGAVETSIMLARYPHSVRRRRSPISAPSIAMEQRIAGFRRSAPRRSPGRRRISSIRRGGRCDPGHGGKG